MYKLAHLSGSDLTFELSSAFTLTSLCSDLTFELLLLCLLSLPGSVFTLTLSPPSFLIPSDFGLSLEELLLLWPCFDDEDDDECLDFRDGSLGFEEDELGFKDPSLGLELPSLCDEELLLLWDDDECFDASPLLLTLGLEESELDLTFGVPCEPSFGFILDELCLELEWDPSLGFEEEWDPSFGLDEEWDPSFGLEDEDDEWDPSFGLEDEDEWGLEDEEDECGLEDEEDECGLEDDDEWGLEDEDEWGFEDEDECVLEDEEDEWGLEDDEECDPSFGFEDEECEPGLGEECEPSLGFEEEWWDPSLGLGFGLEEELLMLLGLEDPSFGLLLSWCDFLIALGSLGLPLWWSLDLDTEFEWWLFEDGFFNGLPEEEWFLCGVLFELEWLISLFGFLTAENAEGKRALFFTFDKMSNNET